MLSLKVTEDSTKRPTQKSQRSYHHTNTKQSSPLTYISQTTIVQDALSIHGRPLCWKMILSKMPVLTFLIEGFHVRYKWYCSGILKNYRRQIKQCAIQAKLHVGVVLIFRPSSTSRSLKMELFCEILERPRRWPKVEYEIATDLCR